MKIKGLGRGLDALLARENEEQEAIEQLATLAIGQIQTGKYQPRTRMDAESLAELAESIKAQGVMQPILVRPLAKGRYEMIAGERRWRAAQMAGLTHVPALVRQVPSESALAMALIENIQRENLNPLEEANGIQLLISEFKMTHQSAAEAVGRSRAAVTNLLRLINLAAPVQQLLLEGKIDMGHARALLGMSTAKQIQLANLVAQKGLSVRQTERLAKEQEKPVHKKLGKPDRDLARLQEELSDKLGTTVKIRPGRRGTGKLIIDYSSLDQLDGLIGKLRKH
ncbi:MAG TPA: ParB/RepB/Spo0J family partition protein [Burkholderiales bacterium]|nr:ParB/RepB/Spo0J family partition protein [Burkholderiales bacterium]